VIATLRKYAPTMVVMRAESACCSCLQHLITDITRHPELKLC